MTLSPPLDLPAAPLILVVEPDREECEQLSAALRAEAFEVQSASDAQRAFDLLREQRPDLIVTTCARPHVDGVDFTRRVRQDPVVEDVPIILVMHKEGMQDVIRALDAGADDFVSRPYNLPELMARIRVKLARPPVPARRLTRDRRTGILTGQALLAPMEREMERARITGDSLMLGLLVFEELPRLRERYGAQLDSVIARQTLDVLRELAGALTLLSHNGRGQFHVLAPNTTPEEAMNRARGAIQRLVDHEFTYRGDRLRLTPSIGLAQYRPGLDAEHLVGRAETAARYAAAHLDLQPVLYNAQVHSRIQGPSQKRFANLRERLRLPTQIVVVNLLLVVIPFLLYSLLGRLGHDISGAAYIAVVASLLITALFILIEGFLALNPTQPPEQPASPYPPASAIIAAYLPNEAATVVETLEAFLRIDYPAGLQVILAYNTPRDLPVETALQDLARRDPRFLPLRVAGSTSKAQNVNAALAEVTGQFTAVFDADHHPDADSFRRAWRWLSNGWDVVQGHCFIRNGDESWVARLVAVEFESIYAVSHPGRAKMHRFGIFGGSNGYWNTRLLRKIRMHGSMLTEDIDSALRTVEAGYKIANDPYLISRELAPATLGALTNQRLRWAQGWFQVSLKHLPLGLRSKHLSLRQKLGFFHLLGWREFYPILSVQMFPIIGYWLLAADRDVDWTIPIFVLTSVFTLSVGPWQALFAYLRAEPTLRRRRSWFWFYLVVGSVFYTPYKNLLAVVAQIKEVRRERAWKVTPRSGPAAQDKPS
ncbi:glycosyltransferase [Deinococcus navajonensis]|uniref:Glycosyltransferase n=1 Tax=Deinococcus navajonensis TaxID=309884 RepID=A0ABV8XTY2_9DEIO